MILTTGIGVLAATLPAPKAWAYPPRQDEPAGRIPPPAAPSGQSGSYIFSDEFDGPAGSAPDASKWAVAKARETIKDPTYWERPENIGQYRDDRRNVFVDGKSNLVLRAAKDGPTYYSGKVQSLWRGGVGHTWEARIKLNCLTPGAWPAYWLGNDDQGEIDVMEWYGNGKWPSATTVHAKANGGEWKTHNIAVDSAWHTWRMPVGRGGHPVLEGLCRRRAALLRRAGELAAGLAVQRRGLRGLSGVQPGGGRFRWRRSRARAPTPPTCSSTGYASGRRPCAPASNASAGRPQSWVCHPDGANPIAARQVGASISVSGGTGWRPPAAIPLRPPASRGLRRRPARSRART